MVTDTIARNALKSLRIERTIVAAVLIAVGVGVSTAFVVIRHLMAN